MIRALLIACLMATPAMAASGTPSDAVKFFYGPPLQYEPDVELRGRFTGPAKALFDDNDKSLANDQEVPCIDASPGIDAQDYDEAELQRTLELTEAVNGDSAEVIARFTLFPDADQDGKREMRWTLKNVDGAWLVSDIESVSGGWKLSDVKCALAQ